MENCRVRWIIAFVDRLVVVEATTIVVDESSHKSLRCRNLRVLKSTALFIVDALTVYDYKSYFYVDERYAVLLMMMMLSRQGSPRVKCPFLYDTYISYVSHSMYHMYIPLHQPGVRYDTYHTDI